MLRTQNTRLHPILGTLSFLLIGCFYISDATAMQREAMLVDETGPRQSCAPQAQDPEQEAVMSRLKMRPITVKDIVAAIEAQHMIVLEHLASEPENKVLLETSIDGAKNTPAHLAAQSAKPEALECLIRYAFNGSYILNVANRNGQTAASMVAFEAARTGNLSVVDAIMGYLPKGRFFEQREMFGKTPIHVAARAGHVHVLEYFRGHHPRKEAAFEDVAPMNWTAAHDAVLAPNTDVLQYLTTLPNRHAVCAPILQAKPFIQEIPALFELQQLVRGWLDLADAQEERATEHAIGTPSC